MTPNLDYLEILAWRVLGYEQTPAVDMCKERNDCNAEMEPDHFPRPGGVV